MLPTMAVLVGAERRTANRPAGRDPDAGGLFLSVIGRDTQRANQLRALIWLGAAILTIGLIGPASA